MNENSNVFTNEDNVNNQPQVQADNEFSKETEYQEFSQALADINAELLAEESDDKQLSNQDNLINCEEQTENMKNQEEEKSDKDDCSKAGDKSSSDDAQDTHEPTEEEKKQYKAYRLQKIFSKINYDLSSPSLKASEIKEKINAGFAHGFNCYMLLTSKIKAVKKQLKIKPNLGAVIGVGESTYLARKCEVRQAKWAGVKEIEYIVPVSVVKEGKKRALIKELTGLKKTSGSKVKFKIALDPSVLNATEFTFALNCAIAVKPSGIVIKNFNSENSKRLLEVAKNCIGKYEIEVSSQLKSSSEINSLTEVGVDYFSVENALELAGAIKQE